MNILITGTSRGIGRYLAQHYLEKGFRVIGVSRGEADFTHENYCHYKADITTEKDVKKLFFDIKKHYGSIDVLINNAGKASMNHFILTPLDTAKSIFDLNFFGLMLMIREGSKLLKKNSRGRIVNVSTVAVPLSLEGESIYAASKAAVESITKTLSKELAAFKITVNAVGPTPIETELISGVPSEKMQKLIDSQTIKRFGKFEDISNVIDFFINDKSDFITGQILYLGGIN